MSQLHYLIKRPTRSCQLAKCKKKNDGAILHIEEGWSTVGLFMTPKMLMFVNFQHKEYDQVWHLSIVWHVFGDKQQLKIS